MAFSYTVLTLRQDAARRLRDLWTGKISATALVGALQLTSNSRVETIGYFSNAHIHIGADATSEDHRLVTNGPRSLTLPADGGIVTQREIGVDYEIHKLWSVPEYNGFVNDALKSIASEAVLSSMDDQSLIVTANANKPNGVEDEYAMPAGFRYISEIWFEDSAGYFDQRIPNNQARPLPGATRKLRFSEWATAQMTVGRNIRLLGQGLPVLTTLADTSEVSVDPDYVTSYVELQALTPLAGGTSTRAIAARDRVRFLGPMVEQKRAAATSEHRVLPGSLVIP